MVNNDELKANVESDTFQIARELYLLFSVRLAQFGNVETDEWFTHELNKNQNQRRLETYIILLSRHKDESLFNQIVTFSAKCIQYDNLNLQHNACTKMSLQNTAQKAKFMKGK